MESLCVVKSAEHQQGRKEVSQAPCWHSWHKHWRNAALARSTRSLQLLKLEMH